MIKNILAQLKFVGRKPQIIPRTIKDIWSVNVLKKPRLRTVDCSVTYGCNSRCVMCSAKDLMKANKGKEAMSVNEIVSVARQAKELGAVHFQLTGGEPTILRPWVIGAIIQRVNWMNYLVSMVTNSINLTEDELEFYQEQGLDTIQLSLESMDSAVHDKIRGVKGNWNKLMEVLDWAKKLDLNICLSCVVANDNFEEVKKIIAFGKEVGVFVLVNPISHDPARSIREMKKEYYDLFKDSHVRADTVINWRGLTSGCPGGIERLYITPYGDVFTCPHVPHSFGNVREEPLSEIYNRICNDPLMNKFYPDCRWLWDTELIEQRKEML